jgi:hypothetical protein
MRNIYFCKQQINCENFKNIHSSKNWKHKMLKHFLDKIGMCRRLFARVVAQAIGIAVGLEIHLWLSFGFSK